VGIQVSPGVTWPAQAFCSALYIALYSAFSREGGFSGLAMQFIGQHILHNKRPLNPS
jgi:hypothetical protein